MLHRLLKIVGRGSAAAALALFIGAPLLAQTGRIEGTVRDGSSNDPVANARVTVVGTQLSAETNENGYYAISEVPAGTYEVRVSVIGFQTVTITNQRVQGGLPTTVNFTLARSILRIEGVVVTGVAEATEAVKLPFTVDQVKAEDMPVPANNPEEMIRGKVAGATVVRGSGRPGTGASVLLRGATSLNTSGRSNEPLYVVDGVILGASMVDIEALQIESMEVVKGAAAAALYGSRAANGVISIQTRRGRDLPEGETRVTIRSEFGQNGIERTLPLGRRHPFAASAAGWIDPVGDTLLTYTDTLFNCDERFADGGAACAPEERIPTEIVITTESGLAITKPSDFRALDRVYPCLTTDAMGEALTFDTDSDGDGTLDCREHSYIILDNEYPTTVPLYDHMDLFIDPGSYYTNSLSVSHRTGTTNFLASISEGKDSGILDGLDGYLRRSARLNVDHRIGQTLDFRASAYYAQSSSDLADDDFDDAANPFFSLYRIEPDINLAERYPAAQAKVDAGTATARDSVDYIVFVPRILEDNPIYNVRNADHDVRRGRFLGSFGLRWRPVDLIDLEANFSYDRSDRNTTQYWFVGYRTFDPDPLNNGTFRKQNAFSEAINVGLTTALSHDWGDIGTVTKASVSLERQRNDFTTAEGRELFVNDTKDLDMAPSLDASGAAATSIGSSSSEVRSLGYFLSSQWDFKDRYIIDALVRRDGSSLFGSAERWNWYYRASGAYRMSEEPWWPFDFLDEFKVRFSRGTAGNRPSFSAQYETYSVSSAGVSKAVLGNRFLKPELATENEFGVDMILGGRASLSISRASTRVDDQILPIPLASIVGFSAQWQNAASIQTNTWEATLQLSVIQTPDVSWSWNVVWDRTRGELLSLNRSPFFLTNYHYLRPGDNLGDLYGDKWATSCDNVLFGGKPGVASTLEKGFYEGTNCLSDGAGGGGAFDINDDGYLVAVGTGNTWTDGVDKGYYGSTITIDGVSYGWGQPIKEYGIRVDTLGVDPSGAAIVATDTVNFKKMGNTAPDFNFGVSQTFRYKGLSLYALVDASIGGDVYNQTRAWSCRDKTCWEYDQTGQDGTLGSTSSDAPENHRKEYFYNELLYNVNDNSSHYVEDGSFVKLREVALRYTLGPSVLSGVLGGLMKRVSFGVVGRNLLTFTSYSGYDPEVSSQGSESALLRIDDFGYPNFRTITGQVEIEF